MSYDLTRLGPHQFERLILALMKDLLGIISNDQFQDSPFGGREARFADPIAWPPDLGRGVWEGQTVVRSYFLHRSKGADEDAIWLYKGIELFLGLSRDAREANVNRRAGSLRNIVIVTNISLDSPPAIMQSINNLIGSFQRKLGIDHWKIVHYQDLCAMLDSSEIIRLRFCGYIAPRDIMFHLQDYNTGISKDLGSALLRQVSSDLLTDQWVHLSQAGDATHQKLALSQVGIDLPLIEEPRRAAHYVLNETGRILRPTEDQGTRHLVLLGGPGQGKTTIGQMICQAYRAALLASPTESPTELSRLATSVGKGLRRSKLVTPNYLRWPIRIELSKYADVAAGEEPTPLVRYIADKLTSRASTEVTPGHIRQWLRAWPWLVVLDGLDEVASVFARQKIMDRVSEFKIEAEFADADLYIVATTRPQGYTGEFRNDEFIHLSLESLSPKEAVWYAQRLAEVRHGEDPDLCEKVIHRARIAAGEESTARLMRTPLQVTIISILLEARERAPQARYALFEAYYETIYAREIAKPGSAGELLETRRNDINALHSRLGLLLHANSERTGEADASMPKEVLRELAMRRLIAEGHPDRRASELADQIVVAVTRRLVLLVPKGMDDVGFEVRSIQEFMAARALVAGPDAAVSKRLCLLIPSVHWRNAWLFAAGWIFIEREHMRREMVALLEDVDNSDYLNMFVAPGANLAYDLLDDGVAASTPTLERMLVNHALTFLGYGHGREMERCADILSRLAKSDGLIRMTVERFINQSRSDSVSYARSVKVLLNFWEKGAGSRSSRTQRASAMRDMRKEFRVSLLDEPFLCAIKERLTNDTDDVYLDNTDRGILERLVQQFGVIRESAKDGSVSALGLPELDQILRPPLEECRLRPAVVEALAKAAIGTSVDAWSAAVYFADFLRSCLERRETSAALLAITPFHGDNA